MLLTANLSLLFVEVPLLERFALAATAGFKFVEVQFPYVHPALEVVQAAKAAGVQTVLINVPAGDASVGERGWNAAPGREGDADAAFARCMAYCDALGVRCVNYLAGRHIGNGGQTQLQLATLRANALRHADEAARHGVRLAIEPLNAIDNPGYLLPAPRAVLAFLQLLDHPNVGMLYDLYHAQRSEGELIRTLELYLPRIAHIQFADAPDRHQPGTGEINFDNVFAALRRLGYQGYAGAEYHPTGRTQDSFGWMKNAVKP